MRKLFLTTLLVVSACSESAPISPPTGTIAQPIQDGVASAKTGAIAILRSVSAEGGLPCSASAIGPNLVLTARHCIGDVANDRKGLVMCEPWKDDAGASHPATTVPVLGEVDTLNIVTGEDIDTAPISFEVVEIIALPGDHTTLCGQDVVLLRTKKTLPGVTAFEPRLDSPVTVGEKYAALGYGDTDSDGGDGTVRRRERSGLTVTIVGEDRDAQGLMRTTAIEWIGNEGACAGDSGGPALDTSGRQVGVAVRASRVGIRCTDTRYAALAPLADWLRAGALSAATKGNYPPPAWATVAPVPEAGASDAAADAGATPPTTTETSSSSCATTPGSASTSWPSATLGLVAMVVVVARKRRR